MKNLSLLLLFIVAFLLTSCDPAQNIIFVNNGTSNLKVKLIVNSKSKNERLNEMKEGDSIVFNLKPENEENEGLIYFGIGRWNEDEITETTQSIKSIEIENADNKIIYKSEDAINRLLLKNKKGIIFKSIEIDINEDFFD